MSNMVHSNSKFDHGAPSPGTEVGLVYCSMFQRVPACSSVLKYAAMCCTVLEGPSLGCYCVAVCCSTGLYVAFGCSVPKCVEICCSDLQCVTGCFGVC